MSLEKLTGQIALDTKEETKKIAEAAGKKAQEILREAEKQRKQLLSDAEKNAAKSAAAQRAELLASAKLEAKRIVETAKEQKAEGILSAVWREMVKQRETKSYPKILKALAEKGVESIGNNCVIMVNKKDFSLAGDFAKKAKIRKAEISAGAVVVSGDGKIICDNSFEAIFAEKKDAIKSELFQKIFVEKGKKWA